MGLNNKHREDACLKHILLRLEKLLIISHSKVITIKRIYVCIQLKNQQTVYSNNLNQIMGGLFSNPIFVDALSCKFNWEKLEKRENELNDTAHPTIETELEHPLR